jgi:pSer/pThr/pTyr-binding forkhead associated (FHA) protein
VTLRLHFLSQGVEPIEVDDQFMATFGRSSKADIPVKVGHLSGLHGEFYMGPEGLVVRDLGSKNGLSVNGEGLEEGLLVHGDRVGVGNIEIFELVDDTLPQTGSKGLSLTPSTMPTALAPTNEPTSAVALSEKGGVEESKGAAKTKLNPLILLGGGIVALLVIWALFKGEKEVAPENLPWNLTRYQKCLNEAAESFRGRDYAGVKLKMVEAIKEYDQNNAAHVLSSMAGLWENKGDLYQNLQWGKAEARVEELLDVHPSSTGIEELSKDLLIWIRREEPHVGNLQKAIRMIEEGNWDGAEALANEVPETCKIKALYAEHLSRINEGRLAGWKSDWEEADRARDWKEAILTLERLRDTKVAPEDLEEKLSFYRNEIEEEKVFREGKRAFDHSRWTEARSSLSTIKEGEKGYEEAQVMLSSIQGMEHQEKLDELLARGNLDGAKDWIMAHFPEKKAEFSQIERMDALLKAAQKASRGKEPETSLGDWEKVLESAGSSRGVQKKAEKAIKKWSNPKVLLGLFTERGKAAEEKEDYESARGWYEKARALDGVTGVRELKDFERVAWLHYNRAMVFDKKNDIKNTHIYLRKALELTEKNSKLYDRIEVFTRKSLEE